MGLVKKYKSEVVFVEQPFADIFIVTLKSLDKPYRYLPGQFLHLTLDDYDPSCPWPESRCFSMQTNQDDEYLKITYSVKGKYTRRMAQELLPGKQVYLKLPYGELFTKQHSKNNSVFIAGGTGITPFLSLFTNKNFSEYINSKLYLGVRDKNFYIYNTELLKAVTINPGFKYEIVYQNTDGMLNIEKMYDSNKNSSIYFISGPPLMIKKFKNYLLSKNVDENNIRTDDWE